MNYYNVHAHNPSSESDDEGDHCPYIFNVYPLEFEVAKEDKKLSCFFSCGIHPWYSEDAEPQLKFLNEIASDHRIIAIGEAGYDKLRGADMEQQRSVFEAQVLLSESIGKPLIIHCVKAWDELLATRQKYKPKQPWIIHAYRGKPRQTKQLLDSGCYFSIGSKFNEESVGEIPLDRLFCETDDKTISIKEVYKELSDSLGVSVLSLAEKIEENVGRIFPRLKISTLASESL